MHLRYLFCFLFIYFILLSDNIPLVMSCYYWIIQVQSDQFELKYVCKSNIFKINKLFYILFYILVVKRVKYFSFHFFYTFKNLNKIILKHMKVIGQNYI